MIEWYNKAKGGDVMRSKKTFMPGTLVVGVDISKNTHVASAQAIGSQQLAFSDFSFENTTVSYEGLLSKISGLGHVNCVIGLEPTGHYWENFAYYLRKKSMKMVFVNPLFTRRMKDIEDNTPGKTDSKDSRIITSLMLQGKILNWAVPIGVYAELRPLSNIREQICRDLIRKANQLHSYIDRLFPGFSDSFCNLLQQTPLYLAKRYPTAAEFLAEDTDKLIQQVARVSRGCLGHDRIMLLKEKALLAQEVTEGTEALKVSLRTILAQIIYLKKQQRQIERRLTERLKEVPYAQYLLSIKGLGEVRLACILGETGDLKEFSSSCELIKFAGLNLYEISSGQHKGKRHISKRGRSLLRKQLYLAVLSMIKRDGVFFNEYQESVAKGKVKMRVMIALMRKLLRILFALARKERYFQKDYDRLTENYLMQVGG